MNRTAILLTTVISVLVLASCSSMETNKEKQNAAKGTCKEYEVTANRAFDFGARNFYRSYAVTNDLKGAQAQLFLIEQGLKETPIGSFAINYKAAEQAYNQSLSKAKAMGCDTSKYPMSPVNAFRRGVRILEEKSK